MSVSFCLTRPLAILGVRVEVAAYIRGSKSEIGNVGVPMGTLMLDASDHYAIIGVIHKPRDQIFGYF